MPGLCSVQLVLDVCHAVHSLVRATAIQQPRRRRATAIAAEPLPRLYSDGVNMMREHPTLSSLFGHVLPDVSFALYSCQAPLPVPRTLHPNDIRSSVLRSDGVRAAIVEVRAPLLHTQPRTCLCTRHELRANAACVCVLV